MSKNARAWVIRPRPTPDAKLRLVCFPSAGSGASAYRAWPDVLGADIEVVCVQPPGREARLFEPLFSHLDPLLDAAMPHLLPALDKPFAVFGHSLGALVAFAFARRLRASKGPRPLHLFVSSRRAPHMPLLHAPFHKLGDPELTEEMRRYAGTPDEVLANKELMELVLPAVRADFQIHETYAHDHEPPFDFPITAFGGDRDHGVPIDGIDAWRSETTQPFAKHIYEGGHFYLNHHRDAVLAVVRAALIPSTGSLI
jgi:medium-chain acyl-[acyl-carrier-protein] hydrolase